MMLSHLFSAPNSSVSALPLVSRLMAPVLLMVFGAAQSATLVTVGTFGPDLTGHDYNGYSYQNGDTDDPGNDGIQIKDIPVTGLSQFDPALGTITGITVSTVFTMDVTVNIAVLDLLDYGQPHSAGFIMADGTQDGIGTLVRYDSPSEPGFTRSLQNQEFDISVSCSGLANPLDPCMNSAMNTFTFSAPDENVFDNTNMFRNLLASDYLGTGSLDEISVASVIYTGQRWDPGTATVNVFEAEGDVTALLNAGTVTITYQFTPVPLPAAVWLFGSGLLGLIGVARGRKVT